VHRTGHTNAFCRTDLRILMHIEQARVWVFEKIY
jgi:hypothetical protein